jgi:hypothetical protein
MAIPAGRNFANCYMELCKQQRLRPLPVICVTLPYTLDFTTDRIKMDDWGPILNSLSLDRSLKAISVHSRLQIHLSARRITVAYYASCRRNPLFLFTSLRFYSFQTRLVASSEQRAVYSYSYTRVYTRIHVYTLKLKFAKVKVVASLKFDEKPISFPLAFPPSLPPITGISVANHWTRQTPRTRRERRPRSR